MTGLTITIPGQPVAWGIVLSGRIVGKDKRGQPLIACKANLRTRPKKSKKPKTEFPRGWRDMASRLMALHWKGPPMEGPMLLDVEAVFPRPKSLDCQHKRQPCSCPSEKLDGRAMPHTSRGDRTNIVKLAEDALVHAGVIEDDRWVYGGTKPPLKRYAARGEDAHVKVTIQMAPMALGGE